MVSREELLQNAKLTSKCLFVMRDIISTNDKALVANLMDISKKIIIDYASLKGILKTAITGEKVKIEVVQDDESKSCNCCGGAKMTIRLFSSITEINVDGKPLSEAEPEVFRYLSEDMNISLTRTYVKNVSEMIQVEKK